MSRFERKYFIGHADYLYLKDVMATIGYKDSYLGNKNCYPIISQYYDTSGDDFYLDKVEGEFQHIKVRRRCYAPDFREKDCFWEAKIKLRDEQVKLRVREGDEAGEQVRTYIDNMIIERSLTPACFVYYEREAYYISTDSEDIRVNFDHNILAHHIPDDCSLLDWNRGWPVDTNGKVLCEVKSRNAEMPALVDSLIKSIDTSRTSFSKYISGRDALKERGDLWI